MYTVLIRGLEFYAHHGVTHEEQVIGHRFKLDLEMDVEGGTDDNDEITETIDYGAAATRITAMCQALHCKTVERLAKTIGERMMQEHPIIQRLTVTIVKRLPPAPIIAEETGVRLTLTR
ncbi:MAG TPA: dihydroneopterin aldolase [Fimbriimonadaceae bacterium]|nr:dihydroneopterin aldolase [Fimbriimonadaceae bacterium]